MSHRGKTIKTAALKLLNGSSVLLVWVPIGFLEHPRAEEHAERVSECVRPRLHPRLRDCPIVILEGDIRSEKMPPLYGSREVHPAIQKAWVRGQISALFWSPMVLSAA